MENRRADAAEELFEDRQELREQLLVSKGGFFVGTLVALGAVASAVSRLTPGHDPESSLKRLAPKTQKRMEREMMTSDPEERRRRIESARRGPGMLSPMRAYRAKKRNDRMVNDISSFDQSMALSIKASGAKAVFESEYALILKFLTADPRDQKNMDVNAMGIRNANVRVQLQWMQTYPKLAKDILSGDVVETISNLREQIGNRTEFLKRQHTKFGGQRSEQEDPSPSYGADPSPLAGYGPVATIRRKRGYDLDRHPRP